MREATNHERIEADIRFENVEMAFGERKVLENFSCHFPAGSVSVVLGGSGAGKSTLLRLVGGLIQPQRGQISVAGQGVVGANATELRSIRDQVAMLFQGGALLDSLSVYENIALPLREHTDSSESAVRRQVEESLADVGLEDVDGLFPAQLSGGMLRRAALARAIVRRPRILLCDEPFSGLDPISVRRIEELLSDLNREHAMTTVVVSHHIQSTLRLADNVLLFLSGRSVFGSAAELHASTDSEVADFFAEASPGDEVRR